MTSLAAITFSLLKGQMSSQVIIWVRQNKGQSESIKDALYVFKNCARKTSDFIAAIGLKW